MPGSSSWMPYAPQGVKGYDDDDDDDDTCGQTDRQKTWTVGRTA